MSAKGININLIYAGITAGLGAASYVMWKQEMGSVRTMTDYMRQRNQLAAQMNPLDIKTVVNSEGHFIAMPAQGAVVQQQNPESAQFERKSY